MRIACFVSPHGMGHAARTAAILGALHDRHPDLETDLYTLVPAHFFAESRIGPFTYHALRTDLGMVQKNPLEEDVAATVAELDRFLPFDEARVAPLANALRARGCRAVLCDIAPLGLAVASRAGIPSVLIENFTWDWIYAGYMHQDARLQPFVEQMRAAFAQADHHLQTAPVCLPASSAFQAGVVSRRPRTPRGEIRLHLGLPPNTQLVLLTGSLIGAQSPALARLREASECTFLLVGGQAPAHRSGNTIILPTTSEYYHPDLVHACDLVVGKLGYSTLAEVYHAGVPFAYLTRPQFPESQKLEAFVRQEMPCLHVIHDELASGRWVEALPKALHLPRRPHSTPNGADTIAEWLLARVLR